MFPAAFKEADSSVRFFPSSTYSNTEKLMEKWGEGEDYYGDSTELASLRVLYLPDLQIFTEHLLRAMCVLGDGI